jgi:hypothetical protein
MRDRRWYAFKENRQADYEQFRDEVYAERGIPSGMMGRWAWHIEIDKRFDAFLRATYADEIDLMMDIAPDYLAITKQIIEGASHDWPANWAIPISRGQPFAVPKSFAIKSMRAGVAVPRGATSTTSAVPCRPL